MTPISNSSLLKELFSLEKPSDLSINSEVITSLYNGLRKLRSYISEFKLIDRAIQQIPEDEALRLNVIESLKNFNHRIADYNKIIDPLPLISCIQEVEELEQQLSEHDRFLGELWAALPFDDELSLETITQIRGWFNNQENQILLDNVTDLDLEECEFIRISKELCKLSNLQTLRISSSSKHVILPFAFEQFKKLKEIKVVEKIICAQNVSQAME